MAGKAKRVLQSPGCQKAPYQSFVDTLRLALTLEQ